MPMTGDEGHLGVSFLCQAVHAGGTRVVPGVPESGAPSPAGCRSGLFRGSDELWQDMATPGGKDHPSEGEHGNSAENQVAGKTVLGLSC